MMLKQKNLLLTLRPPASTLGIRLVGNPPGLRAFPLWNWQSQFPFTPLRLYHHKINFCYILLLLAVAMISGCGGDEKPVVVKTYSVGGTVTGLSGALVIRNNGSDALTITEDGSFIFATELEDKEAYEVTILSLPSGQSCTVFLGTGKIKSKDVTNIEITCI